MKKVLGLTILSLGLISSVIAANRVGPVSQYGQLQAGKNSAGKGRIYGSCPAYSTSGNEVAIQGMSLFWSISYEAGGKFWTKEIVNGLVQKQNIQLIRAAMGADEDWGEGNYFTDKNKYASMINEVVQAAIDNDIYVLIDYHSHCAETNTNNAKSFFADMAQKWGKYDNVIFEIYNEPKHGSCSDGGWYDAAEARNYWKSGIKPYADAVISTIRQYSDNLIVVGTPYYDQYTDAMLAAPISDKNVAYTFHYYAGEDQYRHKISEQGKNAENTMNKGYSVFVTEWGNSAPSGDGGFTPSYSAEWYNWMVQNKLSGANWSVSAKTETASYFNGSAWNYSESGRWTNENVFAKLPKSYTACSGTNIPQSSSSVKPTSSSSVIPQSSSSIPGSSSSINPWQSSSSFVPQQSSSSVVPADLKITGSLTQTVVKGDEFKTITIEGIQSFNRDTWNLHFLTIPGQPQNGKLTISGTVPDYLQEGVIEETLTVNGQVIKISLNVVAKGSVIPGPNETPDIKDPGNDNTTGIIVGNAAQFNVSLAGRTLHISGANSVHVDVFDMQGRPFKSFKQISGSLNLESLPSGNYIVRLRDNSKVSHKRITLK